MSQHSDEELFPIEDVPKKKVIKKPSKTSKIKQLEKQILEQSLVIQKEKNIYKELVNQYRDLKDNSV